MPDARIKSGLIYLLVIPLVCFGGIMFFRERFYSFVTAALAILTVAGYFLHFEKKHSDSTQLVIIAAMTALSVFGRIVFSFLPGFKPCTAIVIITALYMGQKYRSSKFIYNKIMEVEKKEGLNGHLMLIHFGTDNRRTDKFYNSYLDKLIKTLKRKGYTFTPILEAIGIKTNSAL